MWAQPSQAWLPLDDPGEDAELTLTHHMAGVAVVQAALFTAAAFGNDWRYTLDKPAQGWSDEAFDDGTWLTGEGGFGTDGTPGALVGTEWTSGDIWLRRTVDVPAMPAEPALHVHHDEDAEIFVNGRQIASLPGFQSEYRIVPIPPAQRGALREGKNVVAVHCRQTVGAQFIDVHLVDASNVPPLPKPKREFVLFDSRLITRWGREVTPQNAWRDYPRPQMVREEWQNLNGSWDYAITSRSEPAPRSWQGRILVPFCLESKLGGVRRLLSDDEALWYRTSFSARPDEGRRTVLHFEAVDHRCRVFVNGRDVGGHAGGNTAFAVDVTDASKSGPNELVVRVEDDTENTQLRGKQVRRPAGIWYTRVSGIWQTVWLETVPSTHVANLKIATDAGRGTITVQPVVTGPSADLRARLTVSRGGTTLGSTEGLAMERLVVAVPNPELWSPQSPSLYDLRVELIGADGRVIDTVTSYAGIRTVGKERDADGHWRFTLNGKPIFHWGPLDQGWWPDGLLTPPSDAAMLSDIEFLKAAGFNMIRKHIKVEPRRYYWHCDRLGMLVWQDQVSGGTFAKWTHLEPDPVDAVWAEEDHRQFLAEFDEMVSHLGNHPSIVVWTPFNEAWGQHRTREVGEWIRARDSSRLVNIASGGNFWPVGDVADEHAYPHPAFPFGRRFDDFVKVVGEFGGHGFVVPGHVWYDSRKNWGYGDLPRTEAEYRDRYRESITRLAELKSQGIAAGVYTQTTDVEGEVNGLLTYDREVVKIPAEELEAIHTPLGVD